jgi:hypothetical protein
LRQIGNIPDVETAGQNRARQRFEDADQPTKQRRLAGAVGTDDREQGAGCDLACEVVNRRMPVVAQRDIAELQLGCHTHLIASHTTAHRTALTATAAASLEITVMRRIDQETACAGWGEAVPWLWAWLCPWSCPWLWKSERMQKCYIIT